MSAPRASILTSGIGLGVYIPALLIQRQLAALEVDADVEVLERHFTDESRRRQSAFRRACRDDFALAQMAHRMTRGIEDQLDGAAVDALLRRWADEGRRDFMIWSGFWLPIVERYRQMVGHVRLDCCRIDAEVPASFRAHATLARDATEIWLWSWAERKIIFEIPVTARAPSSFDDRDHRLVVHGGGWGLGSYRDVAAELARTSWSCDLVVHDPAEPAPARPDDRRFMIDPEWEPWQRDAGGHRFPPFGALGRRPPPSDGHALFEQVGRCKAIVSKPGGGTLIDSLAAAAPVVLLEPYGYAEAANAALWEHLGFGISYARWRDSGWDESVLRALHRRLVERIRGAEYPRDFAARLQARSRS